MLIACFYFIEKNIHSVIIFCSIIISQILHSLGSNYDNIKILWKEKYSKITSILLNNNNILLLNENSKNLLQKDIINNDFVGDVTKDILFNIFFCFSFLLIYIVF